MCSLDDLQAQLQRLEADLHDSMQRIASIEKLLFRVQWTAIGMLSILALESAGIRDILIKVLG